MKLLLLLLLLLSTIIAANTLSFQPAHIIRDSTLDETRLTVIVPLSERHTDIQHIGYCFSTDTPMDRTKGCQSDGYTVVPLDRRHALVDDATAIRFIVPYWDGRNEEGRFYNPIIYLELRNTQEHLLGVDRVHVDPPDPSSLLTTEEQIEALAPKQGHPESPRSVMWIGISLFVVAAGIVVFGLLYWRKPFTGRKNPANTIEGAIWAADNADWYHKI